jgi:UDP-galactopyranose mutase
MADPEVVVAGSGISGLSFAWKAAQHGKTVLVLERSACIGGCVHSHRLLDGFWFEMGAHTVYNSYGSTLDVVAGTGLSSEVVQRGPARARFGLLRDGDIRWLTPPKVLLELDWLEAAVRFPFNLFRSKDGHTVASYYSRLIGPKNFSQILSPFFAAPPSQSADGFPVSGPGSLFKKRLRRKEFPRSFGLAGGLQTVCDAVARADGVTVETGVEVTSIGRAPGGFRVSTADGRTIEAPWVAAAVPPHVAGPLLRDDFADLSAAIGRVATVGVESVGVVLPRENCWLPECAFVVPVDDLFFSAVTRDPFPDPGRRAFAFHFRPGVSRDEKLLRMSEFLRVGIADLGDPVERSHTLPAPALGHQEIVAAIDAALAGSKLAVTGNYFDGLAIEDCVLRSNAEWARVRA